MMKQSLSLLKIFTTGKSFKSSDVIPFCNLQQVGVQRCLFAFGCHLTLRCLAPVLGSLSSTDLFPAFVRREIIWPFAVKALPVTLCWLLMVWEFWREAFGKLASAQS